MRLCSVCDNEIKGKWCKHCHRFVKSYESVGYSYRQEAQSKSVTEAMPEQGKEPEATTGKSIERNVKKGRTVVGGIGLSVALTCALPMVPDIIDIFKASAERAEANKEFLDDLQFSEEELEFYKDRMMRDTVMQGIEPAERILDKDSDVRYYHPEDIKEMGYPCDVKHFELCLPEFEQWLGEQWTAEYEMVDDSSVYSNLCSVNGDNVSFRFATYREYRNGSEMSFRVDFDTATEQLHDVYIQVEGASVDISLCYGLLKTFYPKSIWTEERFAEELLKAVESEEEYVEFYNSKYLKIAYLKKDGGYSLGFTPGDGGM